MKKFLKKFGVFSGSNRVLCKACFRILQNFKVLAFPPTLKLHIVLNVSKNKVFGWLEYVKVCLKTKICVTGTLDTAPCWPGTAPWSSASNKNYRIETEAWTRGRVRWTRPVSSYLNWVISCRGLSTGPCWLGTARVEPSVMEIFVGLLCSSCMVSFFSFPFSSITTMSVFYSQNNHQS